MKTSQVGEQYRAFGKVKKTGYDWSIKSDAERAGSEIWGFYKSG